MRAELENIKAILANRYARTRSSIAFIDESYSDTQLQKHSQFYVLAAVVVPVLALDLTRQKFTEVADGHYWNTTEEFRDGKTKQIETLLKLISDCDLSVVAAIQTEIFNGDLEQARRTCLLQLLAYLCTTEVKLVVLERRENARARNADNAVIDRAKRFGFLPKSIQFIQGHPGAEHLLWGPDAVAWAYRRKFVPGESRWVRIIREKAVVIDVSPGGQLKKKWPEPAKHFSSDPDSDMGSMSAVQNRSSNEIIAQDRDSVKLVMHKHSGFADPSLDPVELKDWVVREFSKPQR
ncbi:MAG: hypothetical protein RL196_1470 [Actinomycetota bacterium]